jgi:hypothetical protein
MNNINIDDYINQLKIKHDNYVNLLNSQLNIKNLNIGSGLQLLINELIILQNTSTHWKLNIETNEKMIKKSIVADRLPECFRKNNYIQTIKNINLYFEYNKIPLRIDNFNIDIFKKPDNINKQVLCEQDYSYIKSYNNVFDYSISIKKYERNFKYASPHSIHNNFKYNDEEYPHVFLLDSNYYDEMFNEEFSLYLVRYLNDDIWKYAGDCGTYYDYENENEIRLCESPFGIITNDDIIIMQFIITML